MRLNPCVVVFVFSAAACRCGVIDEVLLAGRQDRGKRATEPEDAVNYGELPEVGSASGPGSLASSVAEPPQLPTVKQKRCPSFSPSRLSSSRTYNSDQIVGAMTPLSIQRRDLQSDMMKRLCNACMARPQCRIGNKCDQCKRWCIEKDPSPNDIIDDHTKETRDIPNSNANEIDGDTKISFPNRFGGTSIEDQSIEDSRVSLPAPAGDKRIYTIANFSSGPLKEIICKLLGISDIRDIDKMVVWVTTHSGQPPKFQEGYKKNVSPLVEKMTEVLTDALNRVLDRNRQQGRDFLTNAEIEEVAKNVLATHTDQVSKWDRPRSGSSEDLGDVNDVGISTVPRVNPDLIEGTFDPRLLNDTRDKFRSPPRLGSSREESEDTPEEGTVGASVAKPVDTSTSREQQFGPDKISVRPNVLNPEDTIDESQSTTDKKDPRQFVTKELMKDLRDKMQQRLKYPEQHHSDILNSRSKPQDPTLIDTGDSQAKNQVSESEISENLEQPLQSLQGSDDPQTNIIDSTIAKEALHDGNIVEETQDIQPNEGLKPDGAKIGSSGPGDSGLEKDDTKSKPSWMSSTLDKIKDIPSEIWRNLKEGASNTPKIENFDTAKAVLKDVANMVGEIEREADTNPEQLDPSTLTMDNEIETPSVQAQSTANGPRLSPTGLVGSAPEENLQEQLQTMTDEIPKSILYSKERLAPPKSQIIETDDDRVGSEPIERVLWDKDMQPRLSQDLNQRKYKDKTKLGSPNEESLPIVGDVSSTSINDLPSEFPDQKIKVHGKDIPLKQKTNAEISPHVGPHETVGDASSLGDDIPAEITDEILRGAQPTVGDIQENDNILKDKTKLSSPDAESLPIVGDVSINEIPSEFPDHKMQVHGKDIPLKQKTNVEISPHVGPHETVGDASSLGDDIPAEITDEILRGAQPAVGDIQENDNILKDKTKLSSPDAESLPIVGDVSINEIPSEFPDHKMQVHGKDIPLKQKTNVETSPHVGPHETVGDASSLDDDVQEEMINEAVGGALPTKYDIEEDPFSQRKDTTKLGSPDAQSLPIVGDISPTSINDIPSQFPDRKMKFHGKDIPLKQKANVEISPHVGPHEIVGDASSLGHDIPEEMINEALEGSQPTVYDVEEENNNIPFSQRKDKTKLGSPGAASLPILGDISPTFVNDIPSQFPDQKMKVRGKDIPLKQKTKVEISPHIGPHETVGDSSSLGDDIPEEMTDESLRRPQKTTDGVDEDDNIPFNQRKVKTKLDSPDAESLPLVGDVSPTSTNDIPSQFPDQKLKVHGKDIPLKQKTNVEISPYVGPHETVGDASSLGDDIPEEMANKALGGTQLTVDDVEKYSFSQRKDKINLGSPDEESLPIVGDVSPMSINDIPSQFPERKMKVHGKDIPLKKKTNVEISPHIGPHETVDDASSLGDNIPDEMTNESLGRPQKTIDDVDEDDNIPFSERKDKTKPGSPDVESLPISDISSQFPDRKMKVHGKDIPLKQKTNVQISPHIGPHETVGDVSSSLGDDIIEEMPNEALGAAKPTMDGVEEENDNIPFSQRKDGTKLGSPDEESLSLVGDVSPTSINDIPLQFPDQKMKVHGKDIPLKQKTNVEISPHVGPHETVGDASSLGDDIPEKMTNKALGGAQPTVDDVEDLFSQRKDKTKLGSPNAQSLPIVGDASSTSINDIPSQFPDRKMKVHGKDIPLKQKTNVEISPHVGPHETVGDVSSLGLGDDIPKELTNESAGGAQQTIDDVDDENANILFGQGKNIGKPKFDSSNVEITPHTGPHQEIPKQFLEPQQTTGDVDYENEDGFPDFQQPLDGVDYGNIDNIPKAIDSRFKNIEEPASNAVVEPDNSQTAPLGSPREESSWSNSLGALVPDQSSMQLSPNNMFFIGNGIKLPLQMVRNKDGAVHLSVDLDRLCSCKNNTVCPKNHTGTILGNQAVMENLLGGSTSKNRVGSSFGNIRKPPPPIIEKPNEKPSLQSNRKNIPLLKTAPSIMEKLKERSNLLSARNQRRTLSKWLDTKNSIASQLDPYQESEQREGNIFKRSTEKTTVKETAPEKITMPITNTIELENENQKNAISKNSALEYVPNDKDPDTLDIFQQFLNHKLTNLKSKMQDIERKNELKSHQSEENLMNVLNGINKKEKPVGENSPILFDLKPRFKENLSEEQMKNELFDSLALIKGTDKVHNLENELEEINEYISEYSKDNENALKKEADKLLKTQKNSFIKKEVGILNSVIQFLKTLATDK